MISACTLIADDKGDDETMITPCLQWAPCTAALRVQGNRRVQSLNTIPSTTPEESHPSITCDLSLIGCCIILLSGLCSGMQAFVRLDNY
jgi:hypothetical protein